MVAREKGARGIIVVSGPNSKVKDELIPLENDFTNSSSSISAISVSDDVAAAWLRQADKDLKDLQDQLDQGTPMMGFEVKNVSVGAEIDVRQIKGTGRNVIGRLQMSDTPGDQAILVGAHIDHLGFGQGGSLAKNEERSMAHVGADDNASGVAGMLEVAEYLATLKRQDKLDLRRDVIFAAWSGEELGLHGSKHFCDNLYQQSHSPANTQPAGSSPHEVSLGNSKSSVAGSVYPTIAAALNMDMIGRMDKQLILQGLASSDYWKPEIEKRNAVVGLPVKLSDDTQLPTDASSFYRAGVPILSAFTGSHSDYHTPRDTPEKLNYPDAARIARLMGLIARNLATSDTIPSYIQQTEQPKKMARGAMRAYLGTVPDYGAEVKGVLLSDASKGAPADKAGVKGGDIIVELAGRKIENIYDYTYAIEALKVGQETTIVVLRGDDRIELKITPGSRE
jgi:Zn-dependent M28 family amino/carboxypeptidase